MMKWLMFMCMARQKASRVAALPAPKKDECFWASETEPGIWNVQFSEDYLGIRHKVDGVSAESCWEAVEKAKSVLLLNDYA